MKDFADTTLQNLRTDTIASDAAIRRNSLLMIGTAILFELLDRARVNELSILGLKIDGPDFLLIATPVLISAFFNQSLYASAQWSISSDAYKCVLQARYPDLVRSNAWYAVAPPGRSIVTFSDALSELSSARRTAKVHYALSLALFATLWMVPGGYVLACYFRLLRHFGFGHAGVWMSFAASALLLAFGLTAIGSGLSVSSSAPVLPEEGNDQGINDG